MAAACLRLIPPIRMGFRVPLTIIVSGTEGLSLINSTTAGVRRAALLDIGRFSEDISRGEASITWVALAMRYGMAHSGRVTATYNRDAVNRSVQVREKEPPGSLLYLGSAEKGP